MIHYDNKVIPEYIKQVYSHKTCDMCNSKIESSGYEVNEITIENRIGTLYPEGSWGETTSIDLCSECFNNKLIPWFKKHNTTITVTDWDD